MAKSEVFSKDRMNRCIAIQRTIMEAWRKSNSFQYTVRATESVHGLTLDELRKRYFAVGVGDNITEIPFHDMLVVFSLINQEAAALKNRPKSSASRFSIRYQVSTDFPDEEAARLLSGIRIETPFDEGQLLRIVAVRKPIDDSEEE